METSPKDFAEVTTTSTDGIGSGIAQVLSAVRRVASDFIRLFSLEVRRACLTLVWMVALGAIAALLVVTAWIGLMGALLLWVVSLGASWASALLVISLANLLAAATCIVVSVLMSRNILFPATQRQLCVSPTGSGHHEPV